MDIVSDKFYLLALGNGGITPSADDLAAAPYLDGWTIDNFSLLGHRVVGVVTGHPSLDDGIINTSNPMYANLDGGWMHTRSRLYRLGRHKDEGAVRS